MGARKMLVVVAVQALVLMLAGGAHAKAPAPASSSAGACAGQALVATDVATRRAAADTVLCLVNAERARRGLPSVAGSAPLARAASAHSADMVRRGYFSHVSPGGIGLRLRVARAGYQRAGSEPLLGEALAWGAGAWATPAKLVADLMADSPHRAIVLDARYRDVGVGLALGAPMGGMGEAGATLSLAFGRR